MKGIWRTNPVGDAYWPPWKAMHDRGVTDFYVPALKFDITTGKWVKNINEITAAYRAGVNSQGFGYRIYRDPSWESITDPVALARKAVTDMEVGGVAGYMFDIEYHDPDFVRRTIIEYRRWRPSGPIAWTLEPHQGGWFTPELVQTINSDVNLVVVPQNFYYDMREYDKPPYDNLRNDLINQGVKSSRVKVFYDGAKFMPSDWDGCILSEERI